MVQSPVTDRPKRDQHSAAGIAARIITAIVAGYAIVYFASDALGLALFTAGWTSRADAVLISTNLALLLAPAVVIWSFAAATVWRAVAPPFALAAVLMALAKALQL